MDYGVLAGVIVERCWSRATAHRQMSTNVSHPDHLAKTGPQKAAAKAPEKPRKSEKTAAHASGVRTIVWRARGRMKYLAISCCFYYR